MYTHVYHSEPVQDYICICTSMVGKAEFLVCFNEGIALQKQKCLGSREVTVQPCFLLFKAA